MVSLLTVPFHPCETPTSYVSRLAARNSPFHARDFCLDMGLQFQHVVDGDEAALAAVAALGRIPSKPLIANAIGKDGQDGEKAHRFRGQRILRTALRRSRTLVCPMCLVEDMAGSDLAPWCAAYGRWAWACASIRTCHVHGLELVEIDSDPKPSRMHDVAHTYRLALPRMDELAERAQRRSFSPFEAYCMRRLEHGKGGSPWLDSLGFYAATRTTEMLGVVRKFGRMPNLHHLTDDDWAAAGQAGFEITVEGEEGVRRFLSELQRPDSIDLKGQTGPQALYGRVYQWLAFGSPMPEVDPVRDLVRRHVIETMPLGPGDTVFGKPVERRVVHSVRTASLETGLHPKRLRKILARTGLVETRQQGTLDAHARFDAEVARDLIRQTETSMPLLHAREYLNIPRVQAQQLALHGLLRPVPGTGVKGIDAAYARADLDAFLAALLARSEPIRSVAESQADIPTAMKRACRSCVEIVTLLLDNRLEWVGRLEGRKGYLSVTVDVDEVREKLMDPGHGGLNLRQVELDLGLPSAALKALLAEGVLPSRTAINPVNRCPQTVVDPADLAKFRQVFVTLSNLSKERRINPRRLKNVLEQAGVKPAFDPESIGKGYLYRREHISRL